MNTRTEIIAQAIKMRAELKEREAELINRQAFIYQEHQDYLKAKEEVAKLMAKSRELYQSLEPYEQQEVEQIFGEAMSYRLLDEMNQNLQRVIVETYLNHMDCGEDEGEW